MCVMRRVGASWEVLAVEKHSTGNAKAYAPLQASIEQLLAAM